jgi:hypothetical protein
MWLAMMASLISPWDGGTIFENCPAFKDTDVAYEMFHKRLWIGYRGLRIGDRDYQYPSNSAVVIRPISLEDGTAPFVEKTQYSCGLSESLPSSSVRAP